MGGPIAEDVTFAPWLQLTFAPWLQQRFTGTSAPRFDTDPSADRP